MILFSGARGVPLACFRNAFGALGAPFGCLWNALGVPKVHLNGLSRKGSPILLGPSRSAQQLLDYFGRALFLTYGSGPFPNLSVSFRGNVR